MTVDIRRLSAATDLPIVCEFYDRAADYWLLAEGRAPDAAKAAAFFTDGPPGCDPAMSWRLGLFCDNRLDGVVELSFGFPDPGDAYLGLMLLAPDVRGAGLGKRLLSDVEQRARAAGSRRIYLAVLEANTKGRAFWQQAGFQATGVSRVDDSNGLRHVIHRLAKQL